MASSCHLFKSASPFCRSFFFKAADSDLSCSSVGNSRTDGMGDAFCGVGVTRDWLAGDSRQRRFGSYWREFMCFSSYLHSTQLPARNASRISASMAVSGKDLGCSSVGNSRSDGTGDAFCGVGVTRDWLAGDSRQRRFGSYWRQFMCFSSSLHSTQLHARNAYRISA
jgi:hypothetical protein